MESSQYVSLLRFLSCSIGRKKSNLREKGSMRLVFYVDRFHHSRRAMVAPSRCVCYTETDRGHSSTCPTHAGPEKLEERHLSCHRHHCNRWVSDREMERWSTQRWKSKQSRRVHTLWRKVELETQWQWWTGRSEMRSWPAKGHGSVTLLQLESVSMSDLIYYQRPSCHQWSGLQREMLRAMLLLGTC